MGVHSMKHVAMQCTHNTMLKELIFSILGFCAYNHSVQLCRQWNQLQPGLEEVGDWFNLACLSVDYWKFVWKCCCM